MTGGKILEQIVINLRDIRTNEKFPIWIDIYSSSLAEKWLASLEHLLDNNYHLEKNFCFMGFMENARNGDYILNQINQSIQKINNADIGYTIDDHFSLENVIDNTPNEENWSRNLIHDRMNNLHKYFEDLQGVSGAISSYAQSAKPEIKWHIRQLNLLCHEFESWALSYRKELEAPDWMCPSQLMCWLNAPRFTLDDNDLELFGVETINRPMGAVYVGVNKAIGKHHWEVFKDEGKQSRIDELTTTSLRSQTEAAGDFDIEWGRSAEKIASRQRDIKEFKQWLTVNGFDPEDKSLTIGHPQIGAVDFERTFGTKDPQTVWRTLGKHLDIYSIATSTTCAIYNYHWSDSDFKQKQIDIISGE